MVAGLRHHSRPRDLRVRVRAGVSRRHSVVAQADGVFSGQRHLGVTGSALVVLGRRRVRSVTPRRRRAAGADRVRSHLSAVHDAAQSATFHRAKPRHHQPRQLPLRASRRRRGARHDRRLQSRDSGRRRAVATVVDGRPERRRRAGSPEDPTAAVGSRSPRVASDGTFLAIVGREGLSGMDRSRHPRGRRRCRPDARKGHRPPRPPHPETTALGTRPAPLLERLAWSRDSRWPLPSPPSKRRRDGAWVFDTATQVLAADRRR
jgi:hypothetical protein